jgi:beta-glucanase (GH16 family)
VSFFTSPHRLFLKAALLFHLAVQPTQAANLLANPGFELNPVGQTTTNAGWFSYGSYAFGETDGTVARAGTNFFKVYQSFSGSVNYTGIYQDNQSGPGAAYTAEAWARIAKSDAPAGQNAAWAEVTFRDAGGNVLALYRTAVVTTNQLKSAAFATDTWVSLPVTNQYNPTTYQVTNTVTVLVAPAKTSYVRYQIVFQGDAAYSGGSIYFDDLTLTPTTARTDWNIVWSDEFNGTNLNTNVWACEIGNGTSGWGNNELEYYTANSQNVAVSNGLLRIFARQQSTNGFYFTSARLKTQNLYSRTYGRIEFRAKLPSGLGLWPALWLLGTNITSVSWPGCGEIDVMENTGTNLVQIQGSIHSGSDATATFTLPGGFVTNFHTYAFEWTTNAMNFYVDGLRYQTQTNWSSSLGAYPFPFNKPFFIIMNLAVGGNYVSNPTRQNIIAKTAFPAELQVDYVRVYDHTDPLTLTLQRGNTQSFLSWPSNIVCHLETAATLSLTNSADGWSNLPASASPFAAPLTNRQAFFRLSSP